MGRTRTEASLLFFRRCDETVGLFNRQRLDLSVTVKRVPGGHEVVRQAMRIIICRMSPTPKAASNVEWERWGETDPFWGVASWPGREQGGVNPWTPKEFYDLGSKDWAAYRTRWDNYGRRSGRCVEIGCGAGRLTMHIAHDFDGIVGIDVAEGMLRVAREHVTAANVEFRLSNGVEIPVADSSTDGVFSTHVFQHFESFELALANFAEVARVLRPEGSAMIHLPVYHWPKGLTATERVLSVRRRLVAWRARVQRRRRKPVMRWLAYSNEWLFRELPRFGFADIEIVTFPTPSNYDLHSCVLMRRLNGA